MVSFECGDVMPGCVAKFRAACDDELYEQIARHAVHMHSQDDLERYSPEAVRSSMTTSD